jgi:hypothetical protein
VVGCRARHSSCMDSRHIYLKVRLGLQTSSRFTGKSIVLKSEIDEYSERSLSE